MKKKFLEYYPPDYENVLEKGIFIFDANVLLNLYRYSERTREDVLAVIESNKERIWLPHQFALEYHKNRLEVIEQQRQTYEKVRSLLNTNFSQLCGRLSEFQKHLLIDVEDIKSKLKPAMEGCCEEIRKSEERHPNWFESDTIRNRITSIFADKVGDGYPPERIDEIEKLGEARYEEHIPPGFKDLGKDNGNEFGDLIGWFQILDKAKESKLPVILVTGDQKDDWWWRHAGKVVGPRTELKREVWSIAEVEFHMYTPEKFIKEAAGIKKGKEVKLNPDTVGEIERIGPLDWDFVKLLMGSGMVEGSEPSARAAFLEGIVGSSPDAKLGDTGTSSAVSPGNEEGQGSK